MEEGGVDSPLVKGCDRGDVGSVEQIWNGLAEINGDDEIFGRTEIDTALMGRGSLEGVEGLVDDTEDCAPSWIEYLESRVEGLIWPVGGVSDCWETAFELDSADDEPEDSSGTVVIRLANGNAFPNCGDSDLPKGSCGKKEAEYALEDRGDAAAVGYAALGVGTFSEEETLPDTLDLALYGTRRFEEVEDREEGVRVGMFEGLAGIKQALHSSSSSDVE